MNDLPQEGFQAADQASQRDHGLGDLASEALGSAGDVVSDLAEGALDDLGDVVSSAGSAVLEGAGDAIGGILGALFD